MEEELVEVLEGASEEWWVMAPGPFGEKPGGWGVDAMLIDRKRIEDFYDASDCARHFGLEGIHRRAWVPAQQIRTAIWLIENYGWDSQPSWN